MLETFIDSVMDPDPAKLIKGNRKPKPVLGSELKSTGQNYLDLHYCLFEIIPLIILGKP